MADKQDCGVDLARLKRLRAAVSSTLDRSQAEHSIGLPPTYNSLRAQVLDAVPSGLQSEVSALAPQVGTTGGGVHDVIAAAKDGATAYAHLSALKGWLDAVIGAEE